MPLPKLSELTSNIPGVIDKMKSFVDSIAGSSKTAATEEALANEEDPLKAKMLEVELYIHQMNDLMSQHYSALNTLKTKYSELQNLLGKEAKIDKEESVTSKENVVNDNHPTETSSSSTTEQKESP